MVLRTGAEATRFRPGDHVYYAGDVTRPGANAQYHVVDERIVGRKPMSLDWAEAAAMPLTTITAWEALFDRMDVSRRVAGAASILIVGGAGGVGSIAIQLARQLTELTVIATASRPETRDWVRQLGAHHVVDHLHPLAEELTAAGLDAPGFVLATTQTARHWPEIIKLIAPQGRIAVIDDSPTLDIVPLKRKAVSVHWEAMFARSTFATPDMGQQGVLLDEVSRLLDAGTLRTTVTERLGPLSATTLSRAHAMIESGRTRGKITLDGVAAHESGGGI